MILYSLYNIELFYNIVYCNTLTRHIVHAILIKHAINVVGVVKTKCTEFKSQSYNTITQFSSVSE